MLMPKKTKYRKMQRGRMFGMSKGARTVYFGDFGLMALESAWVSARQIEALRVAVNRHLKKVGKSYLRVFPDKAVSKKPAETRMGKGKGNPEFWVAVVKRGRILIELGNGLTRTEAQHILESAAHKLPIKTRFVDKAELAAEQKAAVS
ncbi:MAG: 50S ribosomal protein L16 [Candidatus Babeliales bacterium]|jgi:large subunit ribosomal protein L16